MKMKLGQDYFSGQIILSLLIWVMIIFITKRCNGDHEIKCIELGEHI